MPAPAPMLSTSAAHWPDGGDWILQPKWDGFRVLIEVPASGPLRGWSRRGANLTPRLGEILEALAQLPPGTVVDGELVAIGQRDGRPAQDFATVQRAVLRGDPQAATRLRFVAFDLLSVAGDDLRSRPWNERDRQLRSLIDRGDSIRLIESLPATVDAHAAIVALGFEGTVLKRPRSTYRAGHQRAWLKHKARHVAAGILLDVHEDRQQRYWAMCDVDGKRVAVAASSRTPNINRTPVTIVYSRIDANGGLREARLADTPSGRSLSLATKQPALESLARTSRAP